MININNIQFRIGVSMIHENLCEIFSKIFSKSCGTLLKKRLIFVYQSFKKAKATTNTTLHCVYFKYCLLNL